MVAKFRDEFEAHIEAARAKLGIADDPADAPELALIEGAFA
jgi:NADH-quinone oxidoreductase subunit F